MRTVPDSGILIDNNALGILTDRDSSVQLVRIQYAPVNTLRIAIAESSYQLYRI